MKWKIFLVVFINTISLLFPYNIIGCADPPDPYDYYTQFFMRDLSQAKNFEPFYYSGLLFLYDEREPQDAAHATSSEWIKYCNTNVSAEAAYDFVCRYDYEALSALYTSIDKKQETIIADSVRHNPITIYFQKTHDLEALGYLMYAKKLEPFVTGSWQAWEPVKRDSVAMSHQIKNGLQLYQASKNDFIRLRYAYQITRLALYSGNAADCIRYYDDLYTGNNTRSVLQGLGVSLKAGALCRLGRKQEAALLFSQQFSRAMVKRVANYVSFDWCVKRLDPESRKSCLSFCKTPEDRADMLALFALGSTSMEGETIKQVYQLTPGAKVLEVLATREINKIEENYLTKKLASQKGGDQVFYDLSISADTSSESWLQEAKELSDFYHTIAQNKTVGNRALFEAGAAYLSYITKNYQQAKDWLENLARLNPTKKIKDQAQLTDLLISINQMPVIDSAAEAALLPGIQWLREKAAAEKDPARDSYFDSNPNYQWHAFYRSIFTEILAKRYHQQNNICKEALCIGNANLVMNGSYGTEDFVQNKMQTKDIVRLYNLQRAAVRSKWDQYLVDHFPMPPDKVSNVMAVSYTRDYNFKTALQWLGKIKNPEELKLTRNPFADIIFDSQDSIFSFDEGKFNKISFLKKMSSLLTLEKQNKASASDLYQLGLGFYNMTYYGRAWETVKYYRSGSDGYSIPREAMPFEKEYYGCFTTESYFKKAMNASTDREQKARCLFMMAKCSQKQVQRPAYDFTGNYEEAERVYFQKFENNKYFPQLKSQYENTGFFKNAFATCSYLRDFISKK